MGMVVRTNTMALNAYRQLGMNNNAVTKSLEKLSSGFRINRAGDDAAGLAISEKMKAQITGLETASANAQDGISLIQTAEGNLNEVHSMLNRMVELATKSANGTYTETERNALQAEVNSLREEIDRIAKSANFNGTNLLDGSLDQGGRAVSGGIKLPEEGKYLGDKTYLRGPAIEAAKTSFAVSFDTMAANLKAGESLEMTIGEGTDSEITLTYTAQTDEKLTADQIAKKFEDAFAATDGNINGQAFTVKAEGNQLKFEQTNDPTSEDEIVDANLDVKINYLDDAGDIITQLNGDIAVQAAGTVTGEANASIGLNGSEAVAAVYESTVAAPTLEAGNELTIGGTKYTIVANNADATQNQVNLDDVNTAAGLASFIAEKATDNDYTITASADKLTYTAKTAGAVGGSGTGPSADPTAPAITVNAGTASNTPAASAGTVGTATTAGKDAVEATKTVNASGLKGDAIATAASANDMADGAVTISKNADDKLELKIGDTVVATSAETVDGNTTDFTFKGADGADLGKVVLSAGVAASDFTDAIETGLTYGAGDPVGPDEPAEPETVASEQVSVAGIDLSNKDNALTAQNVTDLKAAFAAGAANEKATIGTDIEIDLAGVADNLATDGSATVGDLASAILDKAKEAVTAWNTANGETKGYTYENVRISTTQDDTGIMTLAAGDGFYILADKTPKVDNAGGASGVTGNYNAATIKNTQGAVEGGGKFASTTFNLKQITDKGSLDGAVLTIGEKDNNEKYTFKLGDENKIDGNTIIINKNLTEAEQLHQAGELLSRMDNKAFTIGHESNGKIVLDEKAGNTLYTDKLTSVPGFESLISFATTTAKDDTKGLTLQIGDTADDFNKMKVSVGNMSTIGLELDKVDITTADMASDAIDKIKTAINTVSSQRADLGALQNRLEHTINNLDVAVENLSAANSRIRDTDMAKEMMNYTKMNVLVQSAQAMLAQANQQPQSVLQLLQ